jgi:glycosyltransferase involved in cell wall biosynthesis
VTEPTRILMVSRHYWPHLSIDTACRDVRLADALRRAGLTVEVWTPRYSAGWNDRLTHREVEVHRPLVASRGLWAGRRYGRQLRIWLDEHGGDYDIWFCTGLGEESAVVTRADSAGRARKVIWHGGTGELADHRVWSAAWGQRKLAAELNLADAVVVSWASAQRELLGQGVVADRLRRIEIGLPAGAAAADPGDAAVGQSKSRTQAAGALARVNGDFALSRESMVVLACGQMTAQGGMLTLSRAFASLLDDWADLRLWLIGDGPIRDPLHHYFRQQSVRQQVAMPGTFVDFEDLHACADVLVVPSPADGLEDTLPAAAAAAIPLVVADSHDTRAFFNGTEQSVEWFNPGSVESLRAALHACLVDPAGRRAEARRLRRELLTRRPYQQTVGEFQQLFDSLTRTIERRSVGRADGRTRPRFAFSSSRLPKPS